MKTNTWELPGMTLTLILILLGFVLVPVTAQQEAENGEEEDEEESEIEVEQGIYTVMDYEGACDIRLPSAGEDGEWEEVNLGQQISGNTEFSTGINGRLTVSLGGRGLATIGELATGTFGQLQDNGEEFRGRMELESGQVRVVIEAEDMETTYNVDTPSTVASVRGSGVLIRARGDMGDEVYVAHGHLNLPEVPGIGQLTDGHRVQQQMDRWLSAIETTRFRRLAAIRKNGETEIESRAQLEEYEEEVVAIAPGDLGNSIGDGTDLVGMDLDPGNIGGGGGGGGNIQVVADFNWQQTGVTNLGFAFEIDVDFDASPSSSNQGNIMQYDWDFDDGSVAQGLSVPTTQHTYLLTAQTQYNVVLTVTDSAGFSAGTVQTITVGP